MKHTVTRKVKYLYKINIKQIQKELQIVISKDKRVISGTRRITLIKIVKQKNFLF